MTLKKSLAALIVGALVALPAAPALAKDSRKSSGGSTTSPAPAPSTPVLRNWMHTDLRAAWSAGFLGQGATITFVDDFTSDNWTLANLGLGLSLLRHGEWTSLQGKMVAPNASIVAYDLGIDPDLAVGLRPNSLNILNMSYSVVAEPGLINPLLSGRENSIIAHARGGTAVVVKAAGNGASAVDGIGRDDGLVDYFNIQLIGSNAIFVGALDRNGTTSNRALLADYSTFAGKNTAVQDRFLTVGVAAHLTDLGGTSFAAPIVAGYAAILGSKFKAATPAQISTQLLATARTDTISRYNRAIHGRGEASLSRALAPVSIN